ncbi:VanW family protein [Sandaracinus amylolyticus]|nr:VanW family protein [Sandaracinus amylolyticus]
MRPRESTSGNARPRARVVGGLACLLVASALAGLALAQHEPVRAAVPDATVRIAGAEITDGADAGTIAADVARAWGEQPIALRIGEERVEGTRASFGGRIDAAALTARIEQARDPASLMRRLHAQLSTAAPLELPVDVRVDATSTLAMLLERKDHLDVRPRDARIEPRTGAIVPEREGLTLDVHGTLDALADAMRSGAPEASARILRERPRRTARDLANVRLDATLGSFETRYSTSPDAAARTHNLRVAAARLDGLVLMPGETLDFNDVVGERNEANGFRPAPQIAAGELVDGIGGGTCQIAGTLHAAAFFAGLPIVERSPHSRPSTYIWMGLDAVVVYARLNLRFTNDLPFPIALAMSVEGGVVRAEIRGASSGRLVSFARRIDSIAPFRERTEEDASLPAGVRVLDQRGVPGFTVVRDRVIRDVERNQARRQRIEDVYPPTDQIWRVGTGPAAPAGYVAEAGDDHPEYTTDEYLVATQGAGVEGTEITRRGGVSTQAGWTQSYVAPR